MILVKVLVWDGWNRKHLAQHKVSPDEVEEVIRGKYEAIESYRKRILVTGKTKRGRLLAIVLSPEDRNLISYGKGIYYVITAFEKEVRHEKN